MPQATLSFPRRIGLAACAVALSMLQVGAAGAQESAIGGAGDAFGTRIGQESIGLYSESLVRGFNLQQAGNYRLGGAYLTRAAAPPDTIVAGSKIRVGAAALPLHFPAPSGVVEYTLLSGERNRARLEIGFQHLLDVNPRPYVRGFFGRRSEDGRFSVAGGVLGSPSARYIFGNEAEYHSVGLVPQLELNDRWQATGFYGDYHQTYQADVGFIPEDGVRLPQPDRLRYLGQHWSRFDTRNTTSGIIVDTQAQANAWDFSLSSIRSRVDRPRSDFNLVSNIDAAGRAFASTVVARDRSIDSQAYEAVAQRDWVGDAQRNELVLLARTRRSGYVAPHTTSVSVGAVTLGEEMVQTAAPEAAAAE